jgi:hypothetical protein
VSPASKSDLVLLREYIRTAASKRRNFRRAPILRSRLPLASLAKCNCKTSAFAYFLKKTSKFRKKSDTLPPIVFSHHYNLLKQSSLHSFLLRHLFQRVVLQLHW